MQDQSLIIHAVEKLRALAPSGFAMAFHIRFTTATFLFQTYPKDWSDVYSQNGYVMQDPTVMWGFTDLGHKRWSDMLADDPAGMITKAAEHGMRYGFTLAGERDGSRSIASFTRDDRDYTDAEIAEISATFDNLQDVTRNLDNLSPETHEALRQMSVNYTHP